MHTYSPANSIFDGPIWSYKKKIYFQHWPLVQREPTVARSIKEWSGDAVEKLKGSLDCTHWDVFVDSSSDLSELTESVCGYIDFCVECTIPQKTVKMLPNNKPWITKRIKGIFNWKKLAFLKNDKEEYRSVQKELKEEIRKGTV